MAGKLTIFPEVVLIARYIMKRASWCLRTVADLITKGGKERDGQRIVKSLG